MNRPGKPITRKSILMTNRMKELEMKEKSSKSLLANVLDMDDDFRYRKELVRPIGPLCSAGSVKSNAEKLRMGPVVERPCRKV